MVEVQCQRCGYVVEEQKYRLPDYWVEHEGLFVCDECWEAEGDREDRVSAEFGCPECGTTLVDALECTADGLVRCSTCACVYDPLGEVAMVDSDFVRAAIAYHDSQFRRHELEQIERANYAKYGKL